MHAVIVKFKNWKMAFQKFGKFEKQSSKFWNIRKIRREQMNEASNKNKLHDVALRETVVLVHILSIRFQRLEGSICWGKI